MVHARRPRPSRQGFTFVELAVVLVILLVALMIFSSTVSGMARQRTVNRESALAVNGARNMLETLRAEDFTAVYALYNADPADDPDGAGSAPGQRFLVAGLEPAPDAPGGLQGEIVFPTAVDPVDGLELREDVQLRALGMPRDLSGDFVIDDEDHAEDHFILPVQVRVSWTGTNGPRRYELASQLCLYRKP
jgi:prepilin-type N-terminal cleavage/methylation domain-containing protein